jgi:hypothetical protein
MMFSFSHKENRKTKVPTPCMAFDALKLAVLAWVQDATHPQRLLLVSDSLLVQRLAEELSPLENFTTLNGDEAPATRKQRTRLWLNSPSMKLVLSEQEAWRLWKTHPLAEALQWVIPPFKATPIKTICKPLSFQIFPLMPQLMKRHLTTNPSHRLIWIVDGLPAYERPQVEAFANAKTAWQEEMTLSRLHPLEDALATGEVTVLCVDIHSLQALRLPTHGVEGQTLRYHAVYESKHPCQPWQDVASMLPWASFTRHPHEWWRWL